MNVGPQGLLVLGLPAPFVPHSASLSPATATRVLSSPVPVSAPPTGLDECLFFISLVLDPLAIQFSVSSGCARRRSVSTYTAILVLILSYIFCCSIIVVPISPHYSLLPCPPPIYFFQLMILYICNVKNEETNWKIFY